MTPSVLEPAVRIYGGRPIPSHHVSSAVVMRRTGA